MPSTRSCFCPTTARRMCQPDERDWHRVICGQRNRDASRRPDRGGERGRAGLNLPRHPAAGQFPGLSQPVRGQRRPQPAEPAAGKPRRDRAWHGSARRDARMRALARCGPGVAGSRRFARVGSGSAMDSGLGRRGGYGGVSFVPAQVWVRRTVLPDRNAGSAGTHGTTGPTSISRGHHRARCGLGLPRRSSKGWLWQRVGASARRRCAPTLRSGC